MNAAYQYHHRTALGEGIFAGDLRRESVVIAALKRLERLHKPQSIEMETIPIRVMTRIMKWLGKPVPVKGSPSQRSLQFGSSPGSRPPSLLPEHRLSPTAMSPKGEPRKGSTGGRRPLAHEFRVAVRLADLAPAAVLGFLIALDPVHGPADVSSCPRRCVPGPPAPTRCRRGN